MEERTYGKGKGGSSLRQGKTKKRTIGKSRFIVQSDQLQDETAQRKGGFGPDPEDSRLRSLEVDMAEIDKGLPNVPHDRIGNKGAGQNPACHVLEADATTYQLWPRTPILCLSRGLRTEPKSMP